MKIILIRDVDSSDYSKKKNPPDITTERGLTSPDEALTSVWFLRRVESENCFSAFVPNYTRERVIFL